MDRKQKWSFLISQKKKNGSTIFLLLKQKKQNTLFLISGFRIPHFIHSLTFVHLTFFQFSRHFPQTNCIEHTPKKKKEICVKMDFSKNVWVRISFRIKDWVVLFLNSNLRLNVLFLKRSHPQSQLEYPLRTITLKMTKNQRFWFPIWTKKFWADQTFCWVQLLQKLHQVEKIFRTFLFFKFQKKKSVWTFFDTPLPKKSFSKFYFEPSKIFFTFHFRIFLFAFLFLSF